MAFSLTQIAAAYDRPISTTRLHIRQLTEKKLFQKKSPGKHFNQDEVKRLEELMAFKFRVM